MITHLKVSNFIKSLNGNDVCLFKEILILCKRCISEILFITNMDPILLYPYICSNPGEIIVLLLVIKMNHVISIVKFADIIP